MKVSLLEAPQPAFPPSATPKPPPEDLEFDRLLPVVDGKVGFQSPLAAPPNIEGRVSEPVFARKCLWDKIMAIEKLEFDAQRQGLLSTKRPTGASALELKKQALVPRPARRGAGQVPFLSAPWSGSWERLLGSAPFFHLRGSRVRRSIPPPTRTYRLGICDGRRLPESRRRRCIAHRMAQKARKPGGQR